MTEKVLVYHRLQWQASFGRIPSFSLSSTNSDTNTKTLRLGDSVIHFGAMEQVMEIIIKSFEYSMIKEQGLQITVYYLYILQIKRCKQKKVPKRICCYSAVSAVVRTGTLTMNTQLKRTPSSEIIRGALIFHAQDHPIIENNSQDPRNITKNK